MWQWTGLSLHLGPLAFDWKRLSYSPLSVLCFPQTYFKPWGREAVKLDGIRICAYVYARIKLQSSGMPWCRWRQQWFFHEKHDYLFGRTEMEIATQPGKLCETWCSNSMYMLGKHDENVCLCRKHFKAKHHILSSRSTHCQWDFIALSEKFQLSCRARTLFKK